MADCIQRPRTTPRTPAPATEQRSNVSRKRSRGDYFQLQHSKPAGGNDHSASLTTRTASPAPLVSARYRLAGGLDTPTAALSNAFERQAALDAHDDLNFRRGGRTSYHETGDLNCLGIASPLGRERNGRARLQASESRYGWSEAVLSTFTGAADRLRDFCRVGTFRGFFAGGGRGWAMEPLCVRRQEDDCAQASIWQDMDVTISHPRHESVPPSDLSDSGSVEGAHSPSMHAAKKQRQTYDDDADPDGWVLVDQRSTAAPPVSPLRRFASSTSPAQLRHPTTRPSLRRGLITPSRPSPASSRPASFTATRPAATPQLGSRSGSLQASPHSGGLVDYGHNSPLGEEAEKLVRARTRREREENRELVKINRRLEDMIREGREALGTKIEVEVYDDC